MPVLTCNSTILLQDERWNQHGQFLVLHHLDIEQHAQETAAVLAIQFHPSLTMAACKLMVKILHMCFYSLLFAGALDAVLLSHTYAQYNDISSQRTMICHSTKVMICNNHLQCAFQCTAEATCYGIIYNDIVRSNGSFTVCGKCSTTADSKIILTGDLQSLQPTDLLLTGMWIHLTRPHDNVHFGHRNSIYSTVTVLEFPWQSDWQ